MVEELLALYFAIFKFEIEFFEEAVLPVYKGSTIRGAFGETLKKMFCTKPYRYKRCVECPGKNVCLYSYIFETSPQENTEILRLYSNVSHPFLIEPPLEGKKIYKKGENFHFYITLIGKGINYISNIINTVEEMGKTGIGRIKTKFGLKEVINYDLFFKKGINIYKNGGSIFLHKNLLNIIETGDIIDIVRQWKGINEIRFNFLTPLQIVYDENVVNILEFHILVRTLLRRLSTLSYYHCEKRLNLNFKELIYRAMEISTVNSELYWQELIRESNKYRSNYLDMSGLKGRISFIGKNIEEFMIFILLGKYLHVGKLVTSGLGKYDVEFL